MVGFGGGYLRLGHATTTDAFYRGDVSCYLCIGMSNFTLANENACGNTTTVCKRKGYVMSMITHMCMKYGNNYIILFFPGWKRNTRLTCPRREIAN